MVSVLLADLNLVWQMLCFAELLQSLCLGIVLKRTGALTELLDFMKPLRLKSIDHLELNSNHIANLNVKNN